MLSSPQWTRCGPSLANGVHPASASHPGSSFLVHHLQEAIPKLTSDKLFPFPTLVCPICVVHKYRSPAGDTIFQCAPEFSYSFAMILDAKGLNICIWPIQRIHKLVHFWFCILIHLDFLDLSWILDFKHFNLSLIKNLYTFFIVIWFLN